MSVYEIVLQQGRANLKYENEARMDGALILAETLHLYMRYARHVKSASFLYPTNAWTALIRTRGPDFVRTPHFHAFRMLNQHQGAQILGIEGHEDGNDLDIIPSFAEETGKLTLSVLNRQDRTIEAAIRIDDGARLLQSATATVLTGDPEDQNTFDEPDKVTSRQTAALISDGVLPSRVSLAH